MAYLDVSPMIAALRESPDEFDMRRGWLRHLPSRHSFKFDGTGNVSLDAACECALLSVNPAQLSELCRTFESWHSLYWQPTVINRQFAAHFKRPNLWKRFYRRILAKVRRGARVTGSEADIVRAQSRSARIPIARPLEIKQWGR